MTSSLETERIYLDHAATTPLDPEVLEAMLPYLRERYGNPSSIYRRGREARRALDEARDQVAALIGARSSREIVFTGGGSEADNFALKGVAWANRDRGRHIVTSAIEHHAVLNAARFLEDHGFEVTYVQPDPWGMVSPEAVREALREDTILISVMHANNEVGTVQPIREIAALAKERGILFHTDAVQTVGHIPVSVEEVGCDLLSLAAHKFYGPKGVGALYVRRRTRIAPLIHGGGQEQERRAGTENVAGVVGMAKALERAVAGQKEREARIRALRDRLERGILQAIPGTRVNGHPEKRLPGHLNLSFQGIEGESLLLNLDMRGIEASSGSACTSGSIDASHVLLAMGLDRVTALGSVRFTLGKGNTDDEIDRVLQVLPPLVERLRSNKRG